MKVGLLVVLMCLVGVDSNIYTFFSMLTDGLTEHFQNAWIAVKEFVKRPARFKQIRQEKAESPSPPVLLDRDRDIIDRLGWADMVTTATTTGFPTKKYTMAPDMMYYFQRPRHKQVLLPIIKIPQWKTRDDWLDMQKPYQGFFYRKGRFNPGAKDRERGMKTFPITKDNDFYGDVTTAQQLDDAEEDEDIGVMMFV